VPAGQASRPGHSRALVGSLQGPVHDGRPSLRVALCVDVSPDSLHATLYAAAVQADGRARVEVVKAWDGKDCTGQLRRELPGLVKRVKPASSAGSLRGRRLLSPLT
jgi:hypothetical protein